MFDLFSYGFVIRSFEAGIIIAIIAPLIGIFLVLRRYSLIADTLSHVSLAGVAMGLVFKINPLISAIITSLIASLAIEKLRLSKKIFGESALSIFLSGSLALAIVIISYSRGFSVDLFSYLFGSINTVTENDVYVIGILGIFIIFSVLIFYKELVFTTVDEEAAKVSGIPTNFINLLLIILASLTIAISISIIGILLIAALMVIPVITALQFKKSFRETIIIAEINSIISVILGILFAFYFNLSAGGTIVLTAIGCFAISLLYTNK